MFALDIDNNHANVVSQAKTSPAPALNSGPKHNEVWRSLALRSGTCGSNQGSSCGRGPTQNGAVRKEDISEGTPHGEMGGDTFHREHQCSNQPDASKPKTKPLTQRELNRAMFGLITARSIASQAYNNLGRRDPYHLRKAEKTFKQPVSFAELDKNVTKVRNVLANLTINQNVLAATCDEEQCNDGTHNFVAVTLNDLSAIWLCPFFFVQPGRTLATTFLHEAGHMANIDVNWAPGNEQYCRPDDVIECDNICPISGGDLLENVDAWMRFIYCVAMTS